MFIWVIWVLGRYLGRYISVILDQFPAFLTSPMSQCIIRWFMSCWMTIYKPNNIFKILSEWQIISVHFIPRISKGFWVLEWQWLYPETFLKSYRCVKLLQSISFFEGISNRAVCCQMAILMLRNISKKYSSFYWFLKIHYSRIV